MTVWLSPSQNHFPDHNHTFTLDGSWCERWLSQRCPLVCKHEAHSRNVLACKEHSERNMKEGSGTALLIEMFLFISTLFLLKAGFTEKFKSC